MSWNEVNVSNMLQKNDFSSLMSNGCLYYHLDTDREMDAVEWCYMHGFEEQNVPVLYMWIRNNIKHSIGNVCDKPRFQKSLLATIVLLLRVAQDEEVCRRILAQKDLNAYTILREKINHWLEKFKGKQWPTLRDLVSQVNVVGALQSPAWISKCVGGGYRSIYFTTPDDNLVASAQENKKNVDDARDAVREKFLAWAQERTWVEFLSQDFKQTLPTGTVGL